MKLTHIAQALTLALVAVTAYLAWQAQDEFVKANAKMDLLTQQQKAAQEQNAAALAAVVNLPPPSPEPPAAAVAKPQAGPAAGDDVSRPAGSPAPSISSAAGSPAKVASDPVPLPAHMPLTPLQRRIKESPALGKVKEFVPDQGFVVLSAGSRQGIKEGLKLDLRRDAAVVARVKVSSVDEAEAVADVDLKSVPAGVTVQPGDEAIGVVLQQ